MLFGYKPILSKKEAQVLEEFKSKFQDVLAIKISDFGRTHKDYHGIDSDDTRSTRQPTRRFPLAK
jgi:hypothetical protein